MKENVLSASSVAGLLSEGVSRLTEAGVENALWEARELMAAALRDSPVLLPLRWREAPSTEQRRLWEGMVSARAARKPLAQVLGEWNFGDLKLEITPDVLVPRPETEELLAWIVDTLPARVFSLADVGTGSGCLAVALAKNYPKAIVWALDVSPSALTVARRNADAHGVDRRIFFLESDLLSRFSPSVALDAVAANLPYVDEKDMGRLPPEVRHEPAVALNGGKDGLDLIRRLVVQSWERLQPGGRVFLEVGHGQAPAVEALLKGMGYRQTAVRADFAGIERFVMGVK